MRRNPVILFCLFFVVSACQKKSEPAPVNKSIIKQSFPEATQSTCNAIPARYPYTESFVGKEIIWSWPWTYSNINVEGVQFLVTHTDSENIIISGLVSDTASYCQNGKFSQIIVPLSLADSLQITVQYAVQYKIGTDSLILSYHTNNTCVCGVFTESDFYGKKQ